MRRIISLTIAVLLAGPVAAAPLEPTPAQTEGPYYPTRKPAETDADLTRIGAGPAARGNVLALKGRVLDTGGAPVAGARVEIWQVDHQGIYLHPGDPRLAKRDLAFQAYGEALTDATGGFAFRTIDPPAYEGRPRHIHAKITPPGGPTLTTQFYFKDDPTLARDGIARRLGKALERVTLTPVKAGEAMEAAIDVVVKR